MSAVSSSFKRTANKPRRFDKPSQLMTRYGNIANTKLDGLWVKQSSCAQPLERPFELGFTEQIPKILEDNSEHFQAFWETLFENERAKKKPRNVFQTEKFQDYFWETNTSLFLRGSAFRLG